MKLFDWWPLMLKSNHEAVRRENWELRGALGHAHDELRKYRVLVNSLAQGREDTTRKLEKVLKERQP